MRARRERYNTEKQSNGVWPQSHGLNYFCAHKQIRFGSVAPLLCLLPFPPSPPFPSAPHSLRGAEHQTDRSFDRIVKAPVVGRRDVVLHVPLGGCAERVVY